MTLREIRYRTFSHDCSFHPEQLAAIAAAAATFPPAGRGSALLGAAEAMHEWLDRGGTRPPVRAAVAGYWQRCGLLPVASPLLTGARALAGETPWAIGRWTASFLAAVTEEAEFGLALLRRMERQWFTARAAVAGRRRDSSAAAAIDVLAAAPVISASSLAAGIGIAVKNASALLDDFAAQGLAIEVSRRAKRRLYGLAHLAPLRAETAPPRRPLPGRGRGRPPLGALKAVASTAEAAGTVTAASGPEPLPSPPLSPLERAEFDFSDLDRWMREAEMAIRRTSAVLDHRAGASPAGSRAPAEAGVRLDANAGIDQAE